MIRPFAAIAAAAICIPFLFLLSCTPEDDPDDQTMEPVWTYDTQEDVFPSKPWIADGKVFVCSRNINTNKGTVHCINATSGQSVWKTVDANVTTTSPVVYQDKVIYGGFDVHALKVADGTPAWDYASDHGSPGLYSSPAIKDNGVYFGNDWFVKLDAGSGNRIWDMPDDYGEITQRQNNPFLFNGNVYYANWLGEAFCVNQTSGTKVWKVQLPWMFSNAPVANSESVFFGLHVGFDTEISLYCYQPDAVTLRWSKKIGMVTENMLLSGEKLYVTGLVTMYCLNTVDGSEIWKYTLENGSTAGPLLIGDKLLIGGGWDLVCLNALTGALIWRYEAPGPDPDGFSGVTYDGKHIYASCDDGKVYCFEL